MTHIEHPGLARLEREKLQHIVDFELMSWLGIEIVEVTPERVVATMQVTPRHQQPFGYLHGGVSLLLAETVAGCGAFFNCPPGTAAFGVEINANHLRPKRAGLVRAVGLALLSGRTTHVWEVKIYDEHEKLLCAARCTMAVVDLEQPTPPQP